jgi:hypothetical protein
MTGNPSLFELQVPAGRTWGPVIERQSAAALGLQMPAQMSGAAGAAMPIAKKEKGYFTTGCAQTEAAAGGEVKQSGLTAHIRDDTRHGTAGNNLFGCPKKLSHISSLHDHQTSRIEPETG